MRSLRLKLAAAGAAIAVVGALIPGISVAAPGDVFFHGTGNILGSLPYPTDDTYLSITDTEFFLSCLFLGSGEPASQGIDGYMFDLGATAPSGAIAVADGSNDLDMYDLDMSFYDGDCSWISVTNTVGTSETATVPDGTRYIVVSNWLGVNTNIELTVTESGPLPTPSPTATGEPAPEPSPTEDTRVRGVYSENPNDPYFGTADADDVLNLTFEPTQWGMRKINAPQAWQQAQTTGFEINVAVVDSGVDLEHPDFDCADANGNEDWKLNVVPDSAFEGTVPGPDDENGHGTHVAGIIGACTNNGTGVVGIAPDATIIPVQVLDAEGSGLIDNIALGVNRAVDAGAHVINLSLGSSPVGYLDEFFPVMDAALQYAQDNGVVVVAAAGNESLPVCGYPARYPGVVCVSATDPRDNRTWYSTGPQKFTDEPTLVAPGGSGQIDCGVHAEEIFSAWSTHVEEPCGGLHGYISINGTSMASPHVAGVAALVYDRLGGERSVENAQAVIEALIAGAHDLGAPGNDPVFGAGRLDALASVLEVEVVPPPANVTN